MTARCLSTYVDLAVEGYSAGALKRLSDERSFPTHLGFTREEMFEIRIETSARISISGVQDKLSLRLRRGGTLEPTAEGGEYILKPVPGQQLRMVDEVPGNESLTMLLAERVFGLSTAVNSLIRLADEELAYITRRFDRRRDGSKLAQEDFCQLMSRTPRTHGDDYKYDSSYEELASTLKAACPAYLIESEKLFRRFLFNFLVGNGDAHLKNFSLIQSESGDYILAPCYDLVATRIHLPSEWRLALELFADGPTDGQASHGFVTGEDFLELGRRMGLRRKRAQEMLETTIGSEAEVDSLIARSFLSDEAKTAYRAEVETGRKMLSVYSRTYVPSPH